MRRRGCVFGCGSLLLICVLASALGWFVVVPRVSDALETGISDGISTMIAIEVPSVANLRQGGEVEFSFATFNEQLRRSNDNNSVDSILITSSGDEMVLRVETNGQTLEYGFVPTVTSDGTFELKPRSDGSWFQEQIMSVFSGGVEKSFNTWMQQNDLRLVGVSLDGDSITLDVTGN